MNFNPGLFILFEFSVFIFKQYATHDNLDLLKDIHKIGSDAKRIKDINDVNTVAFLLVRKAIIEIKTNTTQHANFYTGGLVS